MKGTCLTPHIDAHQNTQPILLQHCLMQVVIQHGWNRSVTEPKICEIKVSHQVSQAIDIVETGIAGRSDDIVQVIAGQAEVWDLLKAAIHVLQVHSIVLQSRCSKIHKLARLNSLKQARRVNAMLAHTRRKNNELI